MSAVIAGSVLYASTRVYNNRVAIEKMLWLDGKKPKREYRKTNQSLSSFVEAGETSLQKFKEKCIQPFWGDTRYQQLKDLSSTGDERDLSDTEKEVNRYFGLASATLGLAAVSTLVSHPLILLGASGALFYIAIPILQDAYQAISTDRRVKTSVIDSIFVIGCLVTGHIAACALGGWLYYLSRKLLIKTEDHSQRSLINVFGEQPKFVWILKDGIEVEIPFEALEIDDIVVVNGGETIPVDGVVIDGMASIDQRVLTGESQPVEKEVGTQVFASTVVLSGRVHIQVDKAGQETVVAQIGDILSRTTDFKMSIESRGEAIADRTALPTLLFSAFALSALGPVGALVTLNSHLGYNMRLIGPIGMLNFLNLTSQSGILVKDGRALDLLNQVDTIVFDKTGTLTQEKPHVGQIHALLGYEENEVLKLAAAAEYRQTHPIVISILQESSARGLSIPDVDETEYKVGYGIAVMVNTQKIRVGSSRFMDMEQIPIPPPIMDKMASAHRQGHSLVMVAIDDQLVGALEMHAAVRPEAKQIVHALRQRNIKSMYIISGDHEGPTKRLAEELDIDHYFANTLPEDKANLIQELQSSGKFVCYVGDGINDSIALKQANVSISLRGASTIATDTAYIILMDETLKQLPQTFDIARAYHHCMQTSLLMTVIPSILAISGAFLVGSGVATSVILKWFGLFAGAGNTMLPVVVHSRDSGSSSREFGRPYTNIS